MAEGFATSPQAPWRIGVDVGGTFTDLILHDDAGALFVAKVPSTPQNPADGVLAAIEAIGAAHGMPSDAVLADCSLFVHGSTVATNTMLEGKGAKVGMITTEGFRDSLEIRRGIREDMWDHRTPFAPVLVPRSRRIGVAGRLDRDAVEIIPLDEVAVRETAARFKSDGVEAVAVCLLNSFLDPSHERAVGRIMEDSFDHAAISLSAEIAPIMGEYERGSTAVANAYLTPRVAPYLARLDATLTERGLRHPMLMVQSNGGAASVSQVAGRTVNLLLSGPASAVGALNLVAEQTGHDNLISMEIGGTSCDVVMMHKGDVALTDELLIAGYHVSTPAIDVHTVGAGGGTIAHVDAGGMLQVGPQGAGATPGPACYGLGGDHPTVTDALLVLGRLRPGAYAGGAVSLDLELARKAIGDHLAAPLGISIEDAAGGAIGILEQNLLHAVERISIERGYDPSVCHLVAAGGAGPMHGSAVARRLGCHTVYVPRQAGAFCALGMLNADVRRDMSRVLIGDLDAMEPETVADGYAALERQATDVLANEGFEGTNATTERAMDLRYRGQQWSIRVPVETFEPSSIRAGFEEQHQRMYGHIQPVGDLEITALHVTGRGLIPRIVPADDQRPREVPQPAEHRSTYAGLQHGWCETPIYRAENLHADVSLEGPLLLEEVTTTLYVGPGETLEVDRFGNYLIHIGS